MTDPDTIITTKLRKACQARAVELYNALRLLRRGDGRFVSLEDMDQLLKEIDDACS